MKKTISISLFVILLIGIIVGRYFYIKLMHLATYQSPDGNYELIIKRDRSIFTPTMPGGGGTGDLPVEVILKNANGKTIGTSNSNKRCGIFMDLIEVRWDFENNEVYYGKARAIHLKTGKVDC